MHGSEGEAGWRHPASTRGWIEKLFHEDLPRGLMFSPDGKTLAFRTETDNARLYEV
jgi:hypothetical protein